MFFVAGSLRLRAVWKLWYLEAGKEGLSHTITCPPVYHIHSPLTDHLFITALTDHLFQVYHSSLTNHLVIMCIALLPITCSSQPPHRSPVHHSPLTDHSLECYLENRQVTPAASLSAACTRKGTLIYISVIVNGWPRFVKWCSAREVPPRYTHAGPSQFCCCVFVCLLWLRACAYSDVSSVFVSSMLLHCLHLRHGCTDTTSSWSEG